MRTRRVIWLLVVAVAATGVGAVAQLSHVLRRPELATVDARFDVRGRQAAPKDVVVVGVDATTLRQEAINPPLPRRLHARVVDRLRRAGAKVIAYDFVFSDPSPSPADDEALFGALRRTPGVVLAVTQVDRGQTARTIGDNARSIAAPTNFDARSSRGSVIRRVTYAEEGVRHFAVAAAERALGRTVDRSRMGGDGAWINFPGPAGTMPTRSFSDVLAGKTAGLRGKVVVVGATDPIFQDVHATSAGANVPGPEIQAAAIQTILDGFPLRDAPGWTTALVLLLAGAATPLAAVRLTGLRWLPVPPVLAAAGAIGAQLSFDGGRIVPVMAPAAALLTAALGTLGVAYATDLRQRRRMRAAFARFVPESIVDAVVAQAGDDLRLGGERRVGTVLFSDLRGFTRMSEHLEPEQVIALLNHYLTQMSDAILDHGGTVVSYMGDGIMAVFGAPLPQDDHADRALAAAREMLGPRLDAFRAWAVGEGIGAEVAMGVGLCTGPVMSGNVGSPRRLEYTAVGDTTNTASRLEAMTKDAGVPILVSDATREALRGGADGLREVGELPVRGREATIRAWTFA